MHKENQKRLLVLNFEYPPLGGGGGIFTQELTRQSVLNGYSPTVVTLGVKSLPRKEIVDDITIYRTPALLKKSLSGTTLFEAFTYILFAPLIGVYLHRKNNFSFMHAHFILPTGIVALILRFLLRLPYVLSAHGSDVPGHSKDKVPFLHNFTKPFIKLLIKSSVLTLFPSDSHMEKVQVFMPHSKKLKVIPYGINPATFSSEPKRKVILTSARLSPEKGIESALEAYKRLAKSYKEDWEYIVMGDGMEFEVLHRNYSSDVTFVGWTPYLSTAYKYKYSSSSIMVLPSYYESFGFSLLEAMACGHAVIVSDIPSFRSILGSAGLYVKPGDPAGIKNHLEHLMNNPRDIKALGTAAQKRVMDNYTWEKIFGRYEDIYEKILAK